MRFWYCVLYIAGIGLLSQLIGTALPRRWFRANYFPYRAYSLERDGRIYDALHVYRWKDHMPDMSRISRRMVRKSIALSFTCSNAERLVAETCVAEMVHWILILLSIGIYLIWPKVWGMLFAAAYALFNLPFIIIQRYNRPKLIKLSRRLKERTSRMIQTAPAD